MLYVPSFWWHEVTTQDDYEGKSIGLNYFFVPYYHQPGYLTKSIKFIYNRYYSHLRELNTAYPCSKQNICFRSSTTTSTSTKDKKKKSKKGKKQRKGKLNRRNEL